MDNDTGVGNEDLGKNCVDTSKPKYHNTLWLKYVNKLCNQNE